jgi:hypothetical protein
MPKISSKDARDYVTMVAKTIVADHQVTDHELRRVYEVMAALDLGASDRLGILNYLYLLQDELRTLPVPTSFPDEIRLSLAKDTMFIRAQGGNADTTSAADRMLAALRVTEAQKAFLGQWVEWENRALRRLGAGETDLADAGDPKELAARAASVGIPLGALYFAGTVGLSAVGITSGLATLGGASGLVLLGLNPMTAGIAAMIIAGISVKKIADFALKKGERDTQQKALLEAKAIQQRFRHFLVTDIAEFDSEDIESLFSDHPATHVEARRQLNRLLRNSTKDEQEG